MYLKWRACLRPRPLDLGGCVKGLSGRAKPDLPRAPGLFWVWWLHIKIVERQVYHDRHTLKRTEITDITTGMNIASFAFIGGQTPKKIRMWQRASLRVISQTSQHPWRFSSSSLRDGLQKTVRILAVYRSAYFSDLSEFRRDIASKRRRTNKLGIGLIRDLRPFLPLPLTI